METTLMRQKVKTMDAPTPISLCAVIIKEGAKLIVDEYDLPELYVSLTQLRRPFPMPLNMQPRHMPKSAPKANTCAIATLESKSSSVAALEAEYNDITAIAKHPRPRPRKVLPVLNCF